MGEYVQLFLGPPDQPEGRLVSDVERATGLQLLRVESGRFRGTDGTRAVLLILEPNEYVDEPHLPSFAAHPYELEFYTGERTIESERRFLEETFRRLRAAGRYDLFATESLFTRIDPDRPPPARADVDAQA